MSEKHKYIIARVQKYLKGKRIEGKFYSRWRDLNSSLMSRITNSDFRKWRSFTLTCEEFPQVKLTEAQEVFEKIQKNQKSSGERLKSGNLVRMLQNQKFELVESLKAVQEEEEKMEREERRDKKEAKKLEVQGKREDVRMVREETRSKEERRKAATVGLKVGALSVQVKDDGKVDVLRDIAWAYSNLSRLIERDELGLPHPNLKVLKTAPSNGAVALANYAVTDPKTFVEKFVVRLLPRDTSSSGGKGEEETEEMLDPSFGELDRYMKGGEDGGKGD